MNRPALEALRARWDRIRHAWLPGQDPAPRERAHDMLDEELADLRATVTALLDAAVEVAQQQIQAQLDQGQPIKLEPQRIVRPGLALK